MKQLLPFRLGGETYALELGVIQEVVENQRIYDFPGTAPVIAGAIGFHGRIVPVIDLSALLDFPSGNLCNRLIVLTNEQGPVALGTDQVLPIIACERVRVEQPQNSAEQRYIREIIDWDGQMIGLFDLEELQLELESLCV